MGKSTWPPTCWTRTTWPRRSSPGSTQLPWCWPICKEPKDPDATDVGPFPSRRLKSDIFDAVNFSEKDEFVKSLRPEPLASDAEFAVRLFEPSSCCLDSVRAAFCFVCCLPVDELAKAEVESEFYTRVRRMRQTDDMAEVFDWMIELTNVPSKKIFGYKKGADYESGMEARRSGGNWTACYVEGEWRLIDPLWGVQILTKFDTGNYSKLDDQGNVEDSRKSEGQLIYGCNEFYFLTAPENLIITHFPVEELRQGSCWPGPSPWPSFIECRSSFQGRWTRCSTTA
ncbi:hypothetical protein BOX15_Mlig009057g5 [Macrostomum lignano]|uniref:Transglutaminase-like domain-containing protein n=1 Tax=Macrostomum lignano TaxID=282301 RepID=A0A267DXR3_9PLAT|nr:hypothetical protein BOX15_Mlig009057g5 [Macrostomum lignano]